MKPSSPSFDLAQEQNLLAQARDSQASVRARANDEVFRLFRQSVMALCLHLTGNRADAEDAVQETFILIFRALPEFRGESRLATWIHRIALREALRQKAKSRSRQTEPLSHEHGGVANSEVNPAIRREQREALAVALDKLSGEHRTVLALFAIEGLSHQQIAEVLGVPEGTIWSRLHTARKKLAEQLKPVS